MGSAITLHIQGIEPGPQGSKSAIPLKRGGVFTGKVSMRESSRKVRPWREAVRQEVLRSGMAIIAGPVSLSVTFILPRPKSHLTSKGALTKRAPRMHQSRPDLDKLSRATCDGLSGCAYADDSLVCSLVASKRYAVAGERVGAVVTIIGLEG